MNDPLLKEFATASKRPLSERLVRIFDQVLEAEQDTQVEHLGKELEQALAERLNEAAEG